MVLLCYVVVLVRFNFREASELLAYFYERSEALLIPKESNEWVEAPD